MPRLNSAPGWSWAAACSNRLLGGGAVLRHALPFMARRAQLEHRLRVAGLGGEPVPARGLALVAFDAEALRVEFGHERHGRAVRLVAGEPLHRLAHGGGVEAALVGAEGEIGVGARRPVRWPVRQAARRRQRPVLGRRRGEALERGLAERPTGSSARTAGARAAPAAVRPTRMKKAARASPDALVRPAGGPRDSPRRAPDAGTRPASLHTPSHSATNSAPASARSPARAGSRA